APALRRGGSEDGGRGQRGKQAHGTSSAVRKIAVDYAIGAGSTHCKPEPGCFRPELTAKAARGAGGAHSHRPGAGAETKTKAEARAEACAGSGGGRRTPGIRVTARAYIHVRTRGRGTSMCRLPRIPGVRRTSQA